MEILNPAQRDQLDRRIQKIDPDDKFIESILPVFGKAESQAAKSKKYYFLIETMILVLTMLAGVFSEIASADVFWIR